MTYSTWFFSSPALGDLQECECKGVPLAEAAEWFRHHMTNPSAKMGWTHRVIIVDSDDCIIAEWKFGEGITWPPQEEFNGGDS
jgi:hypothetical protein